MNYKAIEFWGRRLGSFDYYIKWQQEIAKKDGAPEDAIYKDSQGVWQTLRDVTNPLVIQEAKKLGLLK